MGIPDCSDSASTVICCRAISALISSATRSERAFSSFGIFMNVVHLEYRVKFI